jgi:ubiquitin carboxyl-terminal hydrolase 2/21
MDNNSCGLSGLANLGNTCYLNSCLQVLSHTTELSKFLNLKTYKQRLNKKPDSVLLLEWDNLRNTLWSQNVNIVVNPAKFVRTLQKVAEIKGYDEFTGWKQNDVSELLIIIIDCFHNALSREVDMVITGKPQNETDLMAIKCFQATKQMYAKDYSEIWNMFYGFQISHITSIKTGELLSSKPEPYFILNLPIPNDITNFNRTPTLLECFDLYVKGEVLEGDNAYLNEKTNEKEAVNKHISFWSLPNILVIDIKRFINHNRKNQQLVTFPLENLDLSKYVTGYNNQSYIYDLYGVCNHSGGTMGGHYTSFVKVSNGEWYHFNDTSVTKVAINEQIISPKAYCFFYRKKSIK